MSPVPEFPMHEFFSLSAYYVTQLIILLLVLIGGCLLLLCSLLFLEAIAFLLPTRSLIPWRPIAKHGIAAVIMIPAHNEALGIRTTIEPLLQLLDQPSQQIEIVVIADNCNDNTAEIARSLGAQVIERQHETLLGKGYAMDFGLRYLARSSPDVVLFVDADCQISAAGALRLIETAFMTQQPVQANYRMLLPISASTKHRVSVFAFAFKNLVRMPGLLRLGGAIVLGGSGMAFPWQSLQKVNLASGEIVEDMKLGIDLAIAGTPVLITPEVLVTSVLPQQQLSANRQRTRWEHGHLQSIVNYAPLLLHQSLSQRRWDLFLMAWDLCIPPLSLLVVFWVVMFLITGSLAGLGVAPTAFSILMVTGGLLLGAIGIGWNAVGRNDVPLIDLFKIPLYILGKIPLYFRFLVKPQRAWERTDRDPVDLI